MSILNLPRRRAIPARIKNEVFSATDGRCARCGDIVADCVVVRGKEVWHRRAGAVLDHSPPLAFRQIVDGAYMPDQHDPLHLQALCGACNTLKTSKGIGPQRSDAAAIAKLRRAEKRRQGLARRKATIPSRPFPKVVKRMMSKPWESAKKESR